MTPLQTAKNGMRQRASEESTLNAWDRLKQAIQRVECALPDQMTAAMVVLVRETKTFDALMQGRDAP